MIRHLTPLPASFDATQVRAATLLRFPKALDANVVTVDGSPNVAAYFAEADNPTGAARTAWQGEVAAHVPAPETQQKTGERVWVPARRFVTNRGSGTLVKNGFGSPTDYPVWDGFNFDPATIEAVAVETSVPDDTWAAFAVDFHWGVWAVGAGDVVWRTRIQFGGDNETLASNAYDDQSVAATAPALRVRKVTTVATMVVAVPGEPMWIEASRVADDAVRDTLGVDAYLHGIMIRRQL